MKRLAAATTAKLHLALILSSIIGCVGIGLFAWVKSTQSASPSSHLEEKTATPEISLELIDQVRKLAQRSQFKQALALVEPIRSSDPAMVFQLVMLKQRLSSQIYDRAVNEYRRGNVAKAIRIAEAIPLDAPSQSRYQTVKADWMRSRMILERAEASQRQGRSTVALDQLEQLRDPVLQASKRIQLLRAEIQASQSVAAAKLPLQIAEVEPSWTEPEPSTSWHKSPDQAQENASEELPTVSSPEVVLSEPTSDQSAASNPYRHHSFVVAPPERSTPVVPSSAGVQSACNRPECDFSGFSN